MLASVQKLSRQSNFVLLRIAKRKAPEKNINGIIFKNENIIPNEMLAFMRLQALANCV